ncbi:hypothetical protein [Amycolatopsis sp. NPDC098790]|uniref:hypothetical protein n=1 Tax=Amycolatopsis sp. NPDC098790 TaxID=3363939 RepID=UPI00380969BD
MTASTVHDVTDHSDSAYEQACQLIETELGGRRITTEPAEPDRHRTVSARLHHLVDGDNTMEA